MEGRNLVQVRLRTDLVRQIDHLRIEWGMRGRGEAIERLLKEALAGPAVHNGKSQHGG